MYSDHDDSTVTLSNAFKWDLRGYPPFASQVLFELYNSSDGGEKYVKVKINDQYIPLYGPCNTS
jgi:hypothetical protein